MNRSILFYVSGHGFGHARRMTQVIRCLLARNPNIQIYVRSAAPARIFQPLATQSIEHCEIDAGLAEIDPLTIDREGSLHRLETFMARRDEILTEEISALRRLNPQLIVADIPFLAGDVAGAIGVPCIGISNFTWDWIYENLFQTQSAESTPGLRYSEDPDQSRGNPGLRSTSDPASVVNSGVSKQSPRVDGRYLSIAPTITNGYAKMSALLELPFGRTCPAIERKMPMPLIAMKSNRDVGDVLAQLGISPTDKRPRVLFGTRGKLAAETFARAAAEAAEFLFLCPHERSETLPANAISFSLSPSLDFSDVTRIADIVISKLGYGIVSECIATQTRLVWPRRFGFAEDEIVAAEAPAVAPMLEISREDYLAGRWTKSLRAAMTLAPPTRAMPTDGAEACAEFILRWYKTIRKDTPDRVSHR